MRGLGAAAIRRRLGGGGPSVRTRISSVESDIAEELGKGEELPEVKALELGEGYRFEASKAGDGGEGDCERTERGEEGGEDDG